MIHVGFAGKAREREYTRTCEGGDYSFSRRSATLAVSAKFCLRYNGRPDSDVFTISNLRTQCVSRGAANPQQTGESRLAVKSTYYFRRLDSRNSGPTVVNIARLRPLIR